MLTWIFTIAVFSGTVRSQINYVSVGNADVTGAESILYSVDGIAWTNVQNPPFDLRGHAVAYGDIGLGKDFWVAAGEGGSTLAWSSDGISWRRGNFGILSTRGFAVAYSVAQNKWVAGGQGTNTLAVSNDGIFWTGMGASIFTEFCKGVAYSPDSNTWVAVGRGTNTIAISADGISWSGLGNIAFTDEGLSVTYANSIFVVTGTSTGSSIAWTSMNGTNWTPASGPISGTTVSAAYGQGKWLAIGNHSLPLTSLATSVDGNSWTTRSVSIGNLTTVTSIIYDSVGDKWFATGSTLVSGKACAYSVNGEVWTPAGYKFHRFQRGIASRNMTPYISPYPPTILNGTIGDFFVNNNATLPVSLNLNGSLTIVGDLNIKGVLRMTNSSTISVGGQFDIGLDAQLRIQLQSYLPLGDSIVIVPINYSSINPFSFRFDISVDYNLSAGESPIWLRAAADYSNTRLRINITSGKETQKANGTGILSLTNAVDPGSFLTIAALGETVPPSNSQLSTGVIVGIAVGAVVVAIGVTMLVIFLSIRHRNQADARGNARLRQEGLIELKRPSPGVNLA